MTKESQNIECKLTWQDEYLKWICGFANAQGGRIFVGDRLSLWNAGTLPIELTIEKLFEDHESFPRNPLIADVCYKAGYIDSWGRGVEKITDACRQAGLPNPVIIERTGGIAVELVKASEKTPSSAKAASERAENDFGIISERIRKEFGTSIANAFDIICAQPDLTAEQIARELGKTQRSVETYIAKLKKAGVIKRKGPKLGGHWEVSK